MYSKVSQLCWSQTVRRGDRDRSFVHAPDSQRLFFIGLIESYCIVIIEILRKYTVLKLARLD